MKKIIIILSVVLISYFGIKLFSFIRYNVDVNNVPLKLDKTLTIKKKKLTNNDYLNLFNSIKIKNEFKNFKKSDNSSSGISETYILYDENNQNKASMKIGITTPYVDNLVTNIDTYDEKNRVSAKDIEKYLNKNNIKNDKELFEFINKNSVKKINIFTKTSSMKENYILNILKTNLLPTLKSITFIDGDYNGYILNLSSDMKQVNIDYNGRIYYLLFIKLDYFNDKKIKDLLESIIIY